MGRGRLLIGLTLFVLAGSASAEPTTLWIDLKPSFTYEDPERKCSTEEFPLGADSVYLAIVREGETTTGARLDTFPGGSSVSTPLALDATELAALTLYRDGNGRTWIEQLPLSLRILNWVAFHSTAPLYGCRPRARLETAVPAPAPLRFPTALLGEAFPTATTAAVEFRGRTKKDEPYRLEISFTERQAPAIEP